MLPGYRLYRTTTAYRTPPFYLKYKLHSTLPQRGDAVSAVLQRFDFSPVETADAKLHVSVEYQPASTVKVLGQTAVRLPRPPIIKDYVRETESLEKKKKGTSLLERGSSQGNTSGFAAAAAAVGEDTLLQAPPLSSPPALFSGGLSGGGGSTPRRGWSSSFRLSPARIYEPPVYEHQRHPSPTFTYGTPQAGSGAVVSMNLPKSASSGNSDATTTVDAASGSLPAPLYQHQEQRQQPQQQGNISHDRSITSAPHTVDGERGDDFLEEKHKKEKSRVSSSPMAIPGSSPVHSRKRNHGFRSSGDLGALERRGGGGGGRDDKQREPPGAAVDFGNQAPQLEYAPEKPMSAPALSYMHHHLSPAPDAKSPPSSNIPAIAADIEEEEKDNKNEAEKRRYSLIDENLMDSSIKEDSATPTIACGTDQHRHQLPPLTVKPDLHPTYVGTTNTSSSSVSSSCCHVPSSPDLPFAFTPSAQYSCSPASVSSSSGTGRGRLLQSLSRPSPPSPSSTSNNNLSGREIPSGIALMRRASWGTRSIRDTAGVGAPLSHGLTNAVGYSISPIRDAMLESVVLSASTPRNLLYTNKIGSDIVLPSSKTTAGGGGGGGGGGGSSNNRDPLLLTFSSAPGDSTINLRKTIEEQSVAVDPSAAGARLPREDSEQLPFDFTAETSEEHSHASSRSSTNSRSNVQQSVSQWQEQGIERSTIENKKGTAAGGGGGGTEGAIQPLFDSQSSTAAIGAFVRFINEAQPLFGLAPIPLEVGMHQLEALKNKVSSGQQR